MAQVKFYSVSALPSSPNDGGVYFVNGGELYKGSQRFGANKIFTAATGATTLSEATAGITGAIGGDILTGFGATKIYTGNASANPSWVDIGQDQAALTSQMKSLVSGLVFDPTAGSIITGIEQDETTGKVTAQISNFTDEVRNRIWDGSASSVANGITVSVVTTSGSVTSVSVEAANLNVTSITADSAAFTSLTVGGSTIGEWIAASTTSSMSATGTAIPTESAVSDFVDKKLESLENAMHFLGTGTITVDSTSGKKQVTSVTINDPDLTPVKGDIVIDATSGLEAVCTGTDPSTTWELIGDNSLYALNAYSSATASLYTGVTTVPGALDAIGAAATTWYGKAKTGTSTTANFYGFTGTIELKSDADPTIAFTNGPAGSGIVTASGDITSGANRLVTANAVYGFVTAQISAAEWRSTSSSNTNGVTVTASVDATASAAASSRVQVSLEIDAAVSAADVSDSRKASNLVTAAAVSAYVAQEINGLDSTVESAMKGVFVSVAEENGKLTGMTVSVAAVSAMAFNATGSADELATTAAVKTFFDNNLVWLGDGDTPINA